MIKNSSILLFCVCIGVCIACNKWEEEPVRSSLQFIHASPNKGTVDLLIDNTELVELPYKSSTDYTTIRAGLRNIKWAVSGNNSDVWLDANLYLPENGIYSVFFVDTLDDSYTTRIPSLIITKESFATTVAGKSQIRFAHLSPDTLTFDLIVQRVSASTITPLDTIVDITSKKLSAFFPMDIDSTLEYNFVLVNKTLEKPMASFQLSKQKLKAKKIYTVSAVGLVNPSSANMDKLELSITEHNQ